MLYFLSIFTFIFTPIASANKFCESIEKITRKVNYCDENSNYLPHARKCFQSYANLVDRENIKIKLLLKQLTEKSGADEQEGSLKNNQVNLSETIATLTKLIAQGNQTHKEIQAYSEDFVLPIYEAFPEDYDLDPKDPAAQKIFREKECYGEPMDALDSIKSKLQSMISDLERTKEKSNDLFLLSKSIDTSLGKISANVPSILPLTEKKEKTNPAKMVKGINKRIDSTVTEDPKTKSK